jgi:NAD-dependent deacetylase
MDIIKAIAEEFKKSKHAVAFTGAGISSESGIPTYRGEGGLWNKYDPNKYASISHFLKDPSYYWNFFLEVRYPQLQEVKPNNAHLALSDLELIGKMETVITQNIDGLHQEAGSSTVIELHGTTRIIYCMDCGREYAMEEIYPKLRKELPPKCEECVGMLRPAVVFFGEMLDPDVLNLAYQAAGKSDLLISIGSSLVVYPAADIPIQAKQSGAALIIINRDPTPMDHLADYVINEKAGEVLPEIVDTLKSL